MSEALFGGESAAAFSAARDVCACVCVHEVLSLYRIYTGLHTHIYTHTLSEQTQYLSAALLMFVLQTP